ncbi:MULTISPECIES: hypothetical protein [Novosphingobium]|uniref:hypothetical protein n=1 Tax=Novosphingobium TaxID=165696 RepID=UPI000D6E2EA7|nr:MULTISPECIES: hypothetical protein [Novosphingobium]
MFGADGARACGPASPIAPIITASVINARIGRLSRYARSVFRPGGDFNIAQDSKMPISKAKTLFN